MGTLFTAGGKRTSLTTREINMEVSHKTKIWNYHMTQLYDLYLHRDFKCRLLLGGNLKANEVMGTLGSSKFAFSPMPLVSFSFSTIPKKRGRRLGLTLIPTNCFHAHTPIIAISVLMDRSSVPNAYT